MIGKSKTRVLIPCVRVCQVSSVMFDSLQPYGLWPTCPLTMGFSRQEYWSGLL